MRVAVEPGTYVVAVSGGVDSVALLDLLAHQKDVKLVVAHFDHGIREDSADDAQFVKKLAETYGVPYVAKREELGRGASEEQARSRRYAFLRSVMKQYQARLVTAHHADDIVETIAINILRGTGWRGLAVLDSVGITRPLLAYRKSEIMAYAHERHLTWHEDSTNVDETYLRNKLRARIAKRLDDDSVRQLLALRDHQVAVKREIDSEATRLIGVAPYSRYFFATIDDTTALELLRAVCLRETGMSPTIPQRRLGLTSIKVAQSGTSQDMGAGVRLLFAKRDFTVVDG